MSVWRRRVTARGLRYCGRSYVAHELTGLIGETVQVVTDPGTPDLLEVWRGATRVCQARVQSNVLSPAETAAVIASRKAAIAAARAPGRAVKTPSPETTTDPYRPSMKSKEERRLFRELRKQSNNNKEKEQ